MRLGQEIYLFFYRYGIKGIYGIISCNVLMGTAIYKTLKTAYTNNIGTYREFLNWIIPQSRKSKYFNLANIANNIINIFLLFTFFIMISGFGAYFSQEYRNK